MRYKLPNKVTVRYPNLKHSCCLWSNNPSCNKYICCMMKPHIKDGKCAISSPMHTSVCIVLLRAPSRHNKYQVTNNNVEIDQLYSRSVQTVLWLDRLGVCEDVDASAWLQCACGIGELSASCELFSVGMVFHPEIPSLHFDTSCTSSVSTRKQPFDTSSELSFS